jgi:hypothetical protein
MGRSVSRTAATKWRERIDEWRRSKLSIAEYCRQKQLSQPSFFAWRKRLAGDDAVPGRGRSRPIENGRDQSSFIELPLSAWPTKGVQITLPGGAVVVLPPDASGELVVAAIRAAMKPAAEARPC